MLRLLLYETFQKIIELIPRCRLFLPLTMRASMIGR
jgi:hypothetical protein